MITVAIMNFNFIIFINSQREAVSLRQFVNQVWLWWVLLFLIHLNLNLDWSPHPPWFQSNYGVALYIYASSISLSWENIKNILQINTPEITNSHNGLSQFNFIFMIKHCHTVLIRNITLFVAHRYIKSLWSWHLLLQENNNMKPLSSVLSWKNIPLSSLSPWENNTLL